MRVPINHGDGNDKPKHKFQYLNHATTARLSMTLMLWTNLVENLLECAANLGYVFTLEVTEKLPENRKTCWRLKIFVSVSRR